MSQHTPTPYKLIYSITSDRKVLKGHTPGGETLSGYFYSMSALRRYAIKHGFSGVKKADSTFMNLLWARKNELDGINAMRRD